jgi:hypothetical protein
VRLVFHVDTLRIPVGDRRTFDTPGGSVGVLAALGPNASTDLIVCQARSGTIASIRDRTGLERALMSAWFGKRADGGLRALRDESFGIPPRH